MASRRCSRQIQIADLVLREIRLRLRFLIDVGLITSASIGRR